MITCKYCGASYETFHSTCPSCGAPLKLEKEAVPEKTEAQIIADKIREICDDHMNSDFKAGESIPENKMEKLRKSFRVFPNGKEIFLYCDTTPFRTGKEGFLICEDGVYWQNSWTTPTSRNFINWDTLKKREIAHKKYDLDLGKGDVIEMAGLGNNASREAVAKLFKAIRDALNG
jgi:hypothetical protein